MECFPGDFLLFLPHQNLAFGQSAGYSPSDPSISGIFLKFPNFLRLMSFGNSYGNSYIHFLVIIIQFRFTCGEGKLCSKAKKSTNVLSRIVAIYLFCWFFISGSLIQYVKFRAYQGVLLLFIISLCFTLTFNNFYKTQSQLTST